MLAALVAVLVPVAVTPVGAAVPMVPRLAVVTHNVYGRKLITIGPAGEAPETVIFEPVSDRPSWSADGGSLALAAAGEEWPVVAVADKNGLRMYPRAFLNGGGDPVMSPDGASVAFQRVQPAKVPHFFESAIWLLDVEDGSVRQLTRWRIGTTLEPTSYSPDGSTLAAQSFSDRGFRAVTIDLRSGRLSLLVRNAEEPTYSPDGTRLAFVRLKNWLTTRRNDATSQPVIELFVARADGSAATLLLRKRGLIAWPSWDPSGSRLAFTRSSVDSPRSRTPLEGDKVMAINADGTCLTKIFSDPKMTLYGSAWQPGMRREAGPISC